MVAKSQLWLRNVIFGGSVISIGVAASTLCYVGGLRPGSFFNSPIKLGLWLALYVWAILAWSVRRIFVGNIRGLRLRGRLAIGYALLKFSTLAAVGALLVLWLASAVAKWPVAPVFIKAALTLMILNMLVGLGGGAVANTILAIRRTKSRVAV